MSSRAQAVTLIVHGVIVVAILAAATALAWHGRIGEQATVAIISSVLGLVGGSAGTLAVVGFNQTPTEQTPTLPRPPPPPTPSP